MNKAHFWNRVKRAFCLAVAGAMGLALSGCGGNGEEIISYSLSADPGNLDPQTADSADAIMIVNNTLEGLYRRTADDTFELGAASDVQVSPDGATYTFTLPQGVKWKTANSDNELQDGTKMTAEVTADDFVYAFQRLFSPSTQTPYASDYYCIQNAQQVKEGRASVDTLGVRAEGDYKLIVQLSHPDPLIEELLSNAPAMPCNREFFEKTKGRYGLNAYTLLSNGPFYVSSWSVDNDNKFVRIRANGYYHDAESVIPAGANLTVRSSADALDAFENEDIDTAIVSAGEKDRLGISDEQAQSFSGSVRGIGFNQKEEHFANANIRRALALAVDRAGFADRLADGEQPASAIVPPAVTIGSASYRSAAGENAALGYDPNAARAAYQQGLTELEAANPSVEDMNTLSLLICENVTPDVERIQQIWQRDLGIFLKLDVQNEEDYQKNLSNGKFDCAVLTLTSDADTPASVLAKFTPDSSGNLLSANPAGLTEQMQTAANQPDAGSMASSYLLAEQLILSEGSFIPIAYETEYFVQQKGISGLMFDAGSRQIYFAYARKQ